MLSNVIFGLLLVFTGANVPIDELPGWMQAISHGASVHARDRGGAGDRRRRDPRRRRGLLATEAAIGVVYAALGFAFIRHAEHLSLRHATLDRN